MCGAASGQMPPLTRKRRDIRWRGVLRAGPESALWGAAVADAEQQAQDVPEAWAQVLKTCSVLVMDDNRSGEVVLFHRPTRTLVISDLLYKADPDVVGPGGQKHHYTAPEWFASGQEELFYNQQYDNSGGLLPSYRTHPRTRSLNIPGMRQSLETVLQWDVAQAAACHTDLLSGDEAKRALRTAWRWLEDEAKA